MTERQSGLRFDIYERVHLADNSVGVKELDEVELVPHIQVYTEGEQAYLKGNLYLTGTYTGEAGEASRMLEHLIPVEITLPLNRIQDVNAVSVDIDGFDVDLLSSRSLNVTGVLTLHGIEMLSVPEDNWQEQEETVFVSRASQLGSEASSQLEQQEAVRSADSFESAAEETPAEASIPESRSEQAEEPQSVAEVFVNADEVNEDDEALEVVAAVAEEPAAPQSESHFQEQPAEQESPKEMKIAFGSKPAHDSSYHLKSLINKGDTRSQGAAAIAESAEAETPTPRTDALEWKRLFARGDAEEQKFSKVRVCIVQKEESLETIAERYHKRPQEILLYNRLSEQELSEGKVLFIPG